MIEAARRRGLRHRLRRLPLCRRRQSAEEPAAALGAGRRATRRCWRASRCPKRARGSAAEIDRDGLNNWGRIPSWEAVQISISPHLPQHAGETIAALAAARGRDPIDLVCDYLIEDNGATRVLITSIAEEDIREIVRSPTALVGSDGNCVADYGIVGQGMPHPRFYGTFPRIIGHYVHERAAAAARAGGPQDDRRDGAGAAAARPRPAQGRLPRRHHDLRPRRLQGPRDLRRPAPIPDRRRARRCSSTASSSSKTRGTPAPPRESSCAAPPTAAWGEI